MTLLPPANTAPAGAPQGRTSQQRLTRLSVILALVWVLPLSAAVGLQLRVVYLSRVGWEKYQQRQVAAQATLIDAQQELTLKVRAGEITNEEWMTRVQKAQAEWSAELAAAGAEWNSTGVRAWQRRGLGLVLMGCGPGVALTLMAWWMALDFAGTRLLGQLRRRGYEWPTRADAKWLVVALGRDVGRIPLADEFHAVPGSHENVDTLIEFVRLRRRVDRS